MTVTRKETAWKKSRKFGVVKGGRKQPKVTDGIFRRFHSLKPPTAHDELPIFLKDNPSKNFYFPINEREILSQLQKLPLSAFNNITHIWLRRIRQVDYENGREFQAMFICGTGVNLITLNAFPLDLKMHFGPKKPSSRQLRFYAKWIGDQAVSCNETGWWFLQWSEAAIKDYYLNYLLLHEVGHFVDRYSQRFRSKSSVKKAEDFADFFAIKWNSKIESGGVQAI
jgi:hypothetical protein